MPTQPTKLETSTTNTDKGEQSDLAQPSARPGISIDQLDEALEERTIATRRESTDPSMDPADDRRSSKPRRTSDA